ncbi:MAG TPA: cupin domain-containing protein [Spirochaetota bacterium]
MNNMIDDGMIFGNSEKRKADLPWNPHPTFKGVSMKLLVKGDETGGRLSCHQVRVDPGCELALHAHEGKLELHEVVAGSGVAFRGEEQFEYTPGTVAVIGADVKHRVVAGDNGIILLAKFIPALA